MADEPTIREVWSMLAARWRGVAMVGALAIAASGIAAFFFQPRILYSSSFELGSAKDGADSIDTVAAKLRETYIPETREAFGLAHPDVSARVPLLDVRIPSGSALVVLESRGTIADKPRHEAIHRSAIASIERDLAPKMIGSRQALQATLDDTTQRLQEAADHVKLLNANEQQIEERRRMLQARRADFQIAVSAAERDRAAAQNDAARAPALLIVDQRILAAKEQLASIDETLAVGLANERSALEKQKSDLMRAQAGYQQTIERTTQVLSGLSAAHVLTVARRSDVPVGPTSAVVFALGSLGGFFTGVLLAIVAGLIARYRQRTVRDT